MGEGEGVERWLGGGGGRVLRTGMMVGWTDGWEKHRQIDGTFNMRLSYRGKRPHEDKGA